MTRPKIYLIDGHSLAYRAFYALPTSMVTTNGQVTNALFGFARMILTILEDRKPAALAVAFDLPAPTFRHKLYKEYKAHRPPSPQEFRTQIPLIKELVQTLNVPCFEVEGFEADDVLGTLAQRAVETGFDAVIITGDRDALQLVTEHIHVLMPQKGLSEVKEYDIKAVESYYEGLQPSQVVELKALVGDSSDNIPGVPGIGEKTALALLQEFKDIETLYARITEVQRETVRKKLIENKEAALQSHQLAAIDSKVPLSFQVEKCVLKDLEWNKLLEFFKQYELNSLTKKYESKANAQGDLFAEHPLSGGQEELSREKVLIARLMKHLLNPERQIWPEDINENDLASIPEFEENLKKQGLYELYRDVELPLASLLEDMSSEGVKLDIAFLAKMSKELEGFISGLEHTIYRLAGEKFNLNSPKQLAEIFFNKLKLPVIKKTKTGFSTDASVLEELAYENEIAQKIMEYRQLAKLKSTYVDALPLLVDPKSGKLHAKFNQTATSTGRLSSSDPNLQNIPIRTEMGKRIRQAFVPSNEKNVLLTADYSQIELRILAHISGDERLIKAFQNNLDIHRATAAEVFGLSLDQVTEQQRSQAKAVNFGIAYGMAARKLARTVGISYDEAQKFIDNYFAKYPGIKNYIDQTLQFAKTNGYVTTLLGRRRYFPEINSANKRMASEAERAAINMPIQGTSADLIKLAMLKIVAELEHTKLKGKLIIQVHDELVFDVPEASAYDLECLVKRIMESVYQLKVPLAVNTAQGKNWLEAK